MFFDVVFLMKYFAPSIPKSTFDFVTFLSVIIIATILAWIIASFQQTIFSANFCGTKYFGNTIHENGHISTMWLIIFGLPVIPVKSMWFSIDSRNSSSIDHSPSQMETLYFPQIMLTFRNSFIVFLLIQIIFVIVVNILSITFPHK
jgi:hypothetical protein